MGMEGIEKNNSLSQEQKEKREELLNMINSIAETITNSDEAYELASKINEFMDKFNNDKENKDKDLKLKDYFLGGLLLSPGDTSKNYEQDDNEKHEIENFIRKLYEQRQEKAA